MSQRLFEEQQALLDLYEKLVEAEEQSSAGKRRPYNLHSRNFIPMIPKNPLNKANTA
jgi:hypothetical protein